MTNDNIELVPAQHFATQQELLEDSKYDDKAEMSGEETHLSVLPAGEEAEIKE
jgi:hypothetical protein